MMKKEARVIKDGFTKSGKQMYILKYNGKKIKYSIDKDKLLKEVEEINKE